ncbi:MAG: T9SS type A sorting domain-containing protein [Bacteroidetes bacterium]|nr:MAG: T9SS type A sorting domain-containing protein [Bacteroidota bacterium]
MKKNQSYFQSVISVCFIIQILCFTSAFAQPWPFRLGENFSTDIGKGIALDATGANVHIIGQFGNFAPIDFDPGAGTAILTALTSSDIFVAKYTSGGAVCQWAISMGAAAGSPKVSQGEGIAVDGSGNVYITGFFEDIVDFNPVGTANLTAVGARDIFVAKYNSSGLYQWAFNIGAAGNICDGHRIRVDGSGDVYVTGYFQGTADFDPVGTNNLTSAGSRDIFVAKYTTAGLYQWAFSVGAANADEGYDIAVDGSGDVYICGNFDGTVDFDPVGTANLTSSGANADGFVAKYTSAAGLYLWAFKLGSGADICRSIALDASANVYVTGNYNGTVDFDPDPGNAVNLTAAGSPDNMFVAKYSSGSIYQWAISLPDASMGTIIPRVIATDGTYVYLTGWFSSAGAADFNPGAGTANPVGTTDIFVAKYTAAAGAYVCAFDVNGTASPDQGNDIVVDASEQMYITGEFKGTSDFNPASPPAANLTSAGNQDIFVAKYKDVCVIVFPVELVSLATSCSPEGEVVIRWATASETNNNYFTVERSLSFGEGWTEVGRVQGAGNSSILRNYEFTDISPLSSGEGPGVRFYRLKQTDYNGLYKYFGPISVNPAECNTNTINVLPTISGNGYFTVIGSPLLWGGAGGGVEITVYGLLGQKIYSAKNESLPFVIDLTAHSAGIYLIQVNTAGKATNQKLIFQK